MTHKLLLIVIVTLQAIKAENCVPRKFSSGDSIVCVCNATYCDSVSQAPGTPKKGTYQWYLSNRAGDRLKLLTGSFSASALHKTTILVNRSETYQSIIGWGGAFTDSAGINIRSLSEKTQDQLLRSYFSSNGSRYNMGRVPIGGTDFSTRQYTLDDVDDDRMLKHFSLAEEDYKYKIPIIQKAKILCPDLQLVSAAWTAPLWMKTNNRATGWGFLKEEYYQTYTDYILKFLERYKSHGIDVWAVSTGNEPSNAILPFGKLSTMGWMPRALGTWVSKFLGPSLATSKLNTTKIIAIDDNRYMLPWFLDDVLYHHPEVSKYIAGTAVHWYWDSFISIKRLDEEHKHRPDKFILMTEACTGVGPTNHPHVKLGSWERAESLILDIIENLRHWVTGWIDWNLALDNKGGPNFIDNNVDAPIIVNSEADEFYKQPLYYAMTHFSAFVPVGSVRIASIKTRTVSTVAFRTPSKTIIVILYNKSLFARNIVLKDTENGNINVQLPARSVNTIIYS